MNQSKAIYFIILLALSLIGEFGYAQRIESAKAFSNINYDYELRESPETGRRYTYGTFTFTVNSLGYKEGMVNSTQPFQNIEERPNLFWSLHEMVHFETEEIVTITRQAYSGTYFFISYLDEELNKYSIKSDIICTSDFISEDDKHWINYGTSSDLPIKDTEETAYSISNSILHIYNREPSCHVNLTDITGKVHLSETIYSSDADFDLSHLVKGLYILHYQNNTTHFTKKIIIGTL